MYLTFLCFIVYGNELILKYSKSKQMSTKTFYLYMYVKLLNYLLVIDVLHAYAG